MKPDAPPSALMLVHGAGSGPWIYRDWPASFPGITVSAVDLQQGLDVATATHAEYAANVVAAAARLPTPVALCGWSMGGLVALQSATAVDAHSVILIDASPPLDVQGIDERIEPQPGSFDPESVYGRFPPGVAARPESRWARGERKRGISVPSLRCPSLVVYGDDFRDERGAPLARHFGSDKLYFPGLDHWDLITDNRVRAAIAEWLGVSRQSA